MERLAETLFPAHAGVILKQGDAYGIPLAFPRTRGGDPLAISSLWYSADLFPAHAGVIPRNAGGR